MRRRTFLLVSAIAGIGLAAGTLTAFGAGGSRGAAVAVRVVDGDTLAVEGQRIRLFGIDAPERDQMCEAAGRSYACGRAAGEALARLIGDARLSCVERDRDPYGRSVATCTAAGRDLNRAMVAEGWAVAYTRYSRDYVRDEAEARRARRGLWQGRFEIPEQYRIERR